MLRAKAISLFTEDALLVELRRIKDDLLLFEAEDSAEDVRKGRRE